MKRGEIARHVSRGAFFLGIEKAAALVSGTLYFALMARWLGPTQYGMLSLALAVVGYATMLTGNFEVFLERYAAEYQARRRLDVLARAHRLALGIKLALGLGTSVALVAAGRAIGAHYHVPELGTLVPLLTLIVATDGLATTGRSLLFGLQRFEWVSGIAILFHVAKTVMVGALWWAHQGLNAMALGFALLAAAQAALFSLAAWVALHRARAAARPEPDAPPAAAEPPLLRQMLRYCVPLLGARVSFLSGQNLGRLVLGHVLDATQLGWYTFAFQTVDRLYDLTSTLPSALLPSLTHLVTRAERERLRDVFDQAFRLVQVAACVLSVGVFLFARELMLLVGSHLFEASAPVLRVFALVPIARTAQQPLTMLFQAMNRPGLVLALAVVKLAVELGGYLVVVPAFGPVGAAWANFAGAAVSYAGALLLLSVVLPEGAVARLGGVARGVLLAATIVVAGWAIGRTVPAEAPALAARIALLVPVLPALFALRLVTRYDLEKLGALPLPAAWLRGARDTVVAGGNRLARAFEPRRAA